MIEDTMSDLDYAVEALGEAEAQYYSECALFGDAGPGQGLQVQRLRKIVASLERRAALRAKAQGRQARESDHLGIGDDGLLDHERDL